MICRDDNEVNEFYHQLSEWVKNRDNARLNTQPKKLVPVFLESMGDSDKTFLHQSDNPF